MRPRIKFDDKPLGRILVDKGILSRADLDSALARQQQGQSCSLIGTLLMDLGLVKEEDILGALNSQYRFPYLPANKYSIRPEVFARIPHDVSRQHCFIPVDQFGDLLVVAMANPLCGQAWKALRDHWQGEVEVCLSTSYEINEAIKEGSEEAARTR